MAEYWTVDPATGAADVPRLGAGGRFGALGRLAVEAGDMLETPLLPGFVLVLPDLFS